MYDTHQAEDYGRYYDEVSRRYLVTTVLEVCDLSDWEVGVVVGVTEVEKPADAPLIAGEVNPLGIKPALLSLYHAFPWHADLSIKQIKQSSIHVQTIV